MKEIECQAAEQENVYYPSGMDKVQNVITLEDLNTIDDEKEPNGAEMEDEDQDQGLFYK